jgi:hypothetical protein
MLRDTCDWLGVVLAMLFTSACGSASGTAPSPILQVGGSYQITPTLLQNACGAVTVLPGPAQVSHAPGASNLRISHAGQTYAGRVEASGAFAMEPLTIDLGGGSSDTVRIDGRFASTGFEATVTVDAAHAGAAPCRYVVGWRASKQGAPNVFP